jgi:hypothetical protein
MGAVCLAYEHGTLSQSLNSYSYANDNPTTKSDPTGKFAAVAAAPALLGAGFALSPETLGLSLVVAGGLSAAYLAYSNRNSGTPGFYQATQMVSGNGYNTDPKFPMNRPPGRWGGLILTTIASAYVINQGMDIADQANDTKTAAQQLEAGQGGYDMPFPTIVSNIGYAQSYLGSASIGSSLPGLYGPSGHSACGLLCAPNPQVQAPPASRQGSTVSVTGGSAPAVGSGGRSNGLGSLHTACGTLCK